MGISVNDVTMKFHEVKALDHISLEIGEGMFGLLGENGAGKTTLMRILTTLLKPESGTVTINGISLEPDNYSKIQKQVGYLPQELGLYPSLTVWESLMYMGSLMGISKKECRERLEYYLEKTSLLEHRKKKNKQLSGGMKRRVGLVQAMLHNPQVLIVDEPTAGLDPEERIRIRNLLMDFSKERTVFLSTHVVEDLAATCTDMAVLKKGRAIYQGALTQAVEAAHGKVWSGIFQTEEELMNRKEKLLISSKQYTSRGLEVKIISDNEVKDCKQVDTPTLEDAYIYMIHYNS